MATAKIDGIEIPKVYVQETTRQIIGDRTRSALGTMHLDVVAVKRQWRLQTRALTMEQRNAIVHHLDGILYGTVAFWIDEFGDESNTVEAYVEIEREERPLQLPDMRALSLVVTEK